MIIQTQSLSAWKKLNNDMYSIIQFWNHAIGAAIISQKSQPVSFHHSMLAEVKLIEFNSEL